VAAESERGLAHVAAARQRAAQAGFQLSSDDEVGRLLAVLAAATPRGGRILELGTGVGVGLAWLVTGLGQRTDVEVLSVENDPDLFAHACGARWPEFVALRCADALALLEQVGKFDLIFADAEGGKTEGLECTIGALRPGGLLVVDDMTARPDDARHSQLWPQLANVREILLGHRGLVCVELAWASGLIVCARRLDA
jgi:predicted O-methyltransferase YrrM